MTSPRAKKRRYEGQAAAILERFVSLSWAKDGDAQHALEAALLSVRNEALEEAAKCADEYAHMSSNDSGGYAGETIAENIRFLKQDGT